MRPLTPIPTTPEYQEKVFWGVQEQRKNKYTSGVNTLKKQSECTYAFLTPPQNSRVRKKTEKDRGKRHGWMSASELPCRHRFLHHDPNSLLDRSIPVCVQPNISITYITQFGSRRERSRQGLNLDPLFRLSYTVNEPSIGMKGLHACQHVIRIIGKAKPEGLRFVIYHYYFSLCTDIRYDMKECE